MNETVNFDWDVQGNNLFDEKAQRWFNTSSTKYIKQYKMNRWGDLLLFFSNNDCLEIFVDSSESIESWRVFKPMAGKEHLVVTGKGINFE